MYVYFIRAGNRGAIKIGWAINVKRRMAAMQTGNAFELKLLAVIPCQSKDHAIHTEKQMHKFFKRQNIRGEWFQGNIDFKKMDNMQDFDTTKSSSSSTKSKYAPIKNAKKKRNNSMV